MNLNDLAKLEPVESKVKDEKDEEVDNSDLEQDLTDALSLLEDCNSMLETILTLSSHSKKFQFTHYMINEMKRIAEETGVFVAQYDSAVDGNIWDEYGGEYD
jgi:hypothetical protein